MGVRLGNAVSKREGSEMSCQGQRARTPKEQEYIRSKLDNGTYDADQRKHEEEAKKIHESECQQCQYNKIWFGVIK